VSLVQALRAALRRAAALMGAAVLLALATPLQAQELQPVPALGARVIDSTGTLSAAEQQALEQRLAAFEAEAGPQIVLLMLASTAPEDIAAYAQRVADTWKIGRREVGDGVLVVVAKDDRRVRIEVAKALEGAIPDLAARQIIDRAMREPFREGRYAEGLAAAVAQLEARIRGENLPLPERQTERGERGSSGFELEELAMFFFIGVAVAGQVFTAVFGRKLGSLLLSGAAGGVAWWLSASLLIAAGAAVAALVLVGLFGIGSAARRLGRGRSLPHVGGWSSGADSWNRGGSWGGGGGFSSGGGGDFGGGGASGDW
jgi:uncharacterized protein